MQNAFRRGFTLIELLIVIAIIAILAAVTMSQFSGSTESARAAQCLNNMRNLATAFQNCAMANGDGNYPAAGSYEHIAINDSEHPYYEVTGWISWLSRDSYRSGRSKTSLASSINSASAFGNDEDRIFAVTNGALWRFAGQAIGVYRCPEHSKLCREKNKGRDPGWSYVMNSHFGYSREGKAQAWSNKSLTSPGGAPDKLLLFAELPALEDESCSALPEPVLDGSAGDAESDGVLQYHQKKWKGTAETIGFNHKSTKKHQYTAHVVFADGHAAKLLTPPGGDATMVQELTTWLCQGDDVAFDGASYVRTNQRDKNTY